jgi:hypothetical protein
MLTAIPVPSNPANIAFFIGDPSTIQKSPISTQYSTLPYGNGGTLGRVRISDGRVTLIHLRGDERQEILDSIEAERLALPIESLVKMAKKFPPPQDWWDEDFDGL